MNEFMLSLLLSTRLFAFIQMFVDYKNIISYNLTRSENLSVMLLQSKWLGQEAKLNSTEQSLLQTIVNVLMASTGGRGSP